MFGCLHIAHCKYNTVKSLLSGVVHVFCHYVACSLLLLCASVFTATLSSEWPNFRLLLRFGFSISTRNGLWTWFICRISLPLASVKIFWGNFVNESKKFNSTFRWFHSCVFRCWLENVITEQRKCFVCLFNNGDMSFGAREEFPGNVSPFTRIANILHVICRLWYSWASLERPSRMSKFPGYVASIYESTTAQFIIQGEVPIDGNRRNAKILKYSNYLTQLHGQRVKDLFRFKRFHFNFIVFLFGA